MYDKDKALIEGILGTGAFEELKKFELYKPGNAVVVDHEEIKSALQIVPRVVLSWLKKNLTPMNPGDVKELDLKKLLPPTDDTVTINVIKREADVYDGEIVRQGKVLYRFKARSLPSVGLVLMTTFELYDIDRMREPKSEKIVQPDLTAQIQQIIDRRLALEHTVNQIVERKLDDRRRLETQVDDALRQSNPLEVEKETMSGKGKLKEFLDKRSGKKELSFLIAKSETSAACPDCGQEIFTDGKFSERCICFGQDKESKIFVAKSESGYRVKFSKNWDPDNIEMLLKILRKKDGK